MLAWTVGIEMRAVARREQNAVLPIQADLVVPRSPNKGIHLRAGSVLDAHATLPEVTLAAVPDRSAEIPGQSLRQIHAQLSFLGEADPHFIQKFIRSPSFQRNDRLRHRALYALRRSGIHERCRKTGVTELP